MVHRTNKKFHQHSTLAEFFFVSDKFLLWKIQFELDLNEQKILISGYNTTVVHGTCENFNWYLTLTEKKNSVSGYTT